MAKSNTSVFVLAFMILLAIVLNSSLISSLAGTQNTFVLDINSSLVNYTLASFNDSSNSKEFDFANSTDDHAYYLRLPKYSNVTNASISLSGKITTIYTESLFIIDGYELGHLQGMSIGDIDGNGMPNIAFGNSNTQGEFPNLYVLNSSDGGFYRSYNLTDPADDIYSTAMEDMLPDSGLEIAYGTKRFGKVGIVNSTMGSKWEISTNSSVNCVKIGNLSGINYLVVGTSDGKVRALNLLNGTVAYLYNGSDSGVYDLAIGDLVGDSKNEVAVATAGGIYILDSALDDSPNLTKSLGTEARAIGIGNITSDEGNEIVVGTADSKVESFNVNASQIDLNWTIGLSSYINSLSVGNAITDESNQTEIVAGTHDKMVYTINNTGGVEWSFTAFSEVFSVIIGEMMPESAGAEVAAGDGRLYLFNFDYFPTNVTISAGNISASWTYRNYSGQSKLRVTVNATGQNLSSDINNFLKDCAADSTGNCNVPLVFHSDWKGKLNLTLMGLDYRYNLSGIFGKSYVPGWSRISDLAYNEPVGSAVYNLTFSGVPAENISIRYISVNESPTKCNFNLTEYSVATVDGLKVCDISSNPIILTSGQSVNFSVFLWDDTMPQATPIFMNASSPYSLSGLDNMTWRRNITLYAINGTFYNVTALALINDSIVEGEEFLFVKYGSLFYNITPDSASSSCNTTTPTYQSISALNDTFRVCKQDTNSNGIVDYFKWVQPRLSSANSTYYQFGGFYNLPPNLSGFNLSPSNDIWGRNFSISVNAGDIDGDAMNVSVWIFENLTGNWTKQETLLAAINSTLVFNLTSNMNWTGVSRYKFEYLDYNYSNPGQIFHSPRNTSAQVFTVQKHNVQVIYDNVSIGNGTSIFRNDTSMLSVFINDTNSTANVSGASCALWVSGILAGTNTTNASGYCNIALKPNRTYEPSNKTWIIGIFNDLHYGNSNSTPLNITLRGWVRPAIVNPYNFSFYRYMPSVLKGRLIDEYGQSIVLNNYNCSFSMNSVGIGYNMTSLGNCSINYTAGCTDPDDSVGPKDFSVNISRIGGEDFYNISSSVDTTPAILKDYLSVSIDLPIDSNYYVFNTIPFNASVINSCPAQGVLDIPVSWNLARKSRINITVSDKSGELRQNYPVAIPGSLFSSGDYNLSDWKISRTKLLLNDTRISFSVIPWADSNKSVQNQSLSYMNEASELVFYVNLSAYENRTYLLDIAYESQEDYGSAAYNIFNAGFDSANFSYWNASTCSNIGCGGTVTASGSEKYANISADGGQTSITQNLPNLTYPSKIYIKYKAWGDFNSSQYPGFFYLSIGEAICNLTGDIRKNADATGYVPMPQNWTISNCTNATFSSARNISIILQDQGNGGLDPSNIHALIDYVCFGDSLGSCINFHSGLPLQLSLSIKKSLGNVTDYTIPGSEEVGRRKIFAEAEAGFYESGKSAAFFNITGFAKISNFTLNSSRCTAEENNLSLFHCMVNATFDLVSAISNNFTLEPVADFSVLFSNNTTSLGANTTSALGYTFYGARAGENENYTYYANITSQPEIFYNSSFPDGHEILVLIDNNATSGNLTLNVTNVSAQNISLDGNFILQVLWILENKGTSGMYSVEVQKDSLPGVEIPEISCPSVAGRLNCTRAIQINVTAQAEVGNYPINFTALWINGDGTRSNATANFTLMVQPSQRIKFAQGNISMEAPVTRNTSAEFTLVNYGNINLTGIYLNLSGSQASDVLNWAEFSVSETNLSKSGLENITVSFDVPEDAVLGIYRFNITATIPNCTGNCSDILPFELNITPLDWKIEPNTNITKMVGLKEEVNRFGYLDIINLQDTDLTFNISVYAQNGTSINFISLNQTDMVAVTQVTVPAGLTRTVEIYYNTSVSPNTTGTYNYTLDIDCLNESIFPIHDDTGLFFEIINFTVDIISPTINTPFGGTTPILANDPLRLEVQARMGDDYIVSNITWTVFFGGEECLKNSDPIYFPSWPGWSINCSAPDIPFNPIYNDVEVVANYTPLNIELSDVEEDAAIYRDVVAPWFSNVSAPFIDQSANQNNIGFEVNVTDNQDIAYVWAEITTPNGEVIMLNSSNYTATERTYRDFDSNNYIFSFHNPNLAGDYDIRVYANDTLSYQDSITGWFDIYRQVNASGNLTDADGEQVLAKLTFYRAGHNLSPMYKMHNMDIGTNIYNWTLHKRKYDVRIESFGQAVLLNDWDYNLTANSAVNPFSIDYFPNMSSPDISNVLLPDTSNRQKILLAMVVESPLDFTGANFTLNYTDALAAGSFTENLLEVFVCQNWSFDARICNDGEFSYLAGTGNLSGSNPNAPSNTFDFYSNHLSAYALAESSYPDKWGVAPQSSPQTDAPGGGSSGGDGSSPVNEPKVICGNSVCEIGENADNCPEDCSKEFSLNVDTNLDDVNVFPGDTKAYWVSMENTFNKSIKVTASFSDNLKGLFLIDGGEITVPAKGKVYSNITLNMPRNQSVGTYGGYLTLSSGGTKKNLPVTIRVLESASAIFTVEAKITTIQIAPDGRLDFNIKLTNLGDKELSPINITYYVKDPKNKEVFKAYRTNVSLQNTVLIPESFSMSLAEEGTYTLEVWANYNGKNIMDVVTFDVFRPLFQSPLTVGLIIVVLAMVSLAMGIYVYRYYRLWSKDKEKQQRYLYPLDYNTLPKEGFKIGKFAAKENYFFYDPKELSTHLIVAGATGAGKSVAASIFAEEALDKNIPVIVFDPTSQWTGFVKPCKDTNLLNKYEKFNMNDFDIKSYPGLIYDVEKPDFNLDIKRFINPGEITVFCLSKLKPGEYDQAVNNIIAKIFKQSWEESTELKVVLVFDEVHRLLEKYGGSGGYLALEKAAREFRKWGIGVVMCSQVLADFKEAISGNVLTEIQLNTKSLTDIDKVKTKYGEKYAERITRMGVGAGLIQHPKYNNGQPFFVEFRPTKHNPHKITDEELALYKNYTERLDKIRAKIDAMKQKGVYSENYEIDYKLALDKLKRGNFRMSEIYISSLERSLEGVKL